MKENIIKLIKKGILFAAFWLVPNFLIAQININEGFTLIDQQKFDEAIIFFDKAIKAEPKNKGALIGYGRAIGLKGNAQEANLFFDSLTTVFPNDPEILLNLAESILWKKDAILGEKTYLDLIKKFPDNYVCYIGLGNSLSMQQRYAEALIEYEKSAKLNPKLDYTRLLIKYTLVNRAYQLYTLGRNDESKSYYKAALKADSVNVQALNGIASVYLAQDSFPQAEIYFTKQSKVVGSEAEGLMMLAYTKKLQGQYQQAFSLNRRAHLLIEPKDTALFLKTGSNLLYGYLWNQKINKAASWYKTLAQNYPDRNELIVPKVQVNVYKGNLRHAADILRKLVKKDSTSFDANLGLSDLYMGLGNYQKANYYIKKTLKYYPFQNDAIFLQKKLHKNMTPQNNIVWNYFLDNQTNTSQQYTLNLSSPLGWKSNIGLEYKYLQIGTSDLPRAVKMNTFSGILSVRPALGLELSLKGSNNQLLESQANTSNWLYQLKGAYRFEGGHSVELSNSRELFYYTADLLKRNILSKSNTLVYNGKIHNLIGIYVNAQKSAFSDDNSKTSLYTSAYYSAPLYNVKFGVSRLYLSFDLQVPVLYYSPEKMTSFEGFFQYNNYLLEEKKWQYSAELAVGQLQEKGQEAQLTYRLTGYISHRFGYNDNWYVRVIRGNSSQAQLNLYSVTLVEAGLRISPEGLLMKRWR
jgi:tetratricopeptide (TPR) repeat protein